MIRSPLENKYNDIGSKAFRDFSLEIHVEIQGLLDKLNEINPIKGVSMGMGCGSIDGNISIIDEDGEPFVLDFHQIESPKSGWRDDVDPRILPLADRINELLEFLIQNPFMLERNFAPSNKN
jgi:hypothetical protein